MSRSFTVRSEEKRASRRKPVRAHVGLDSGMGVVAKVGLLRATPSPESKFDLKGRLHPKAAFSIDGEFSTRRYVISRDTYHLIFARGICFSRKSSAARARNSLAQHGAEGGVVGKAEIDPSPVGTADVFTPDLQTRVEALTMSSASRLAPDDKMTETSLLPPKVKTPGAQLAVIVQIRPLLDVMIRAVEDERHLLHVAIVRPDVGSILELEDHAIGIAAGDCHHARLVVRRAIVRRHQLVRRPGGRW